MRSSNVAVTIPNDANSVPERFTAAPDGDGDVDLSWTAPDNGASEYVIYRNGVEQARTSGLGYTVSNPTSGTSWWQISAVSTGGTEGARTPSIPVDVDDQNPCTPPASPAPSPTERSRSPGTPAATTSPQPTTRCTATANP